MKNKHDLIQLNIGSARVFVAGFDGGVDVKPVAPAARQRYIESCNDGQAKRQRYCVWVLLDYALKQTVGKGVDELSFTVDTNGKWHCDGGVDFSLSHCGNVVAVAVSAQPVGVDVEAVKEHRFNLRLANHILTGREQALFDKLPQERQPQALLEFWAKKESLFKRDGGKTFVPSAIDTTTNNSSCLSIVMNDEQYTIAVSI